VHGLKIPKIFVEWENAVGENKIFKKLEETMEENKEERRSDEIAAPPSKKRKQEQNNSNCKYNN
jgi:hypothetical protein